MGNKVTVTMPGTPGRTLIGYIHPDGAKWLGQHQNTGSSIQLLGAPTEDSNVAVYADLVLAQDELAPIDVDLVDIKPADLRIETWRPHRGGWSTKADNCCRITHVPTGITVTVEGDDDARSIHAAKALAMQKLELALAVRGQDGQLSVEDPLQAVDEWLHSFVDQLADYVGACVDQSRPDARPENAGKARPMYQKLYGQVRSAVMRLFEMRQRAAPELAQLHGAVAAAAHKLREAGQTALAQRLEDSAAGVELVLQEPEL